MNVKNLNLQELNSEELKSTDGGFFFWGCRPIIVVRYWGCGCRCGGGYYKPITPNPPNPGPGPGFPHRP